MAPPRKYPVEAWICPACGNKKQPKAKTCWACFVQAVHERPSHGVCIDCGADCTYGAQRCMPCRRAHEAGLKPSVINHCPDCNRIVNGEGVRFKSCAKTFLNSSLTPFVGPEPTYCTHCGIKLLADLCQSCGRDPKADIGDWCPDCGEEKATKDSRRCKPCHVRVVNTRRQKAKDAIWDHCIECGRATTPGENPRCGPCGKAYGGRLSRKNPVFEQCERCGAEKLTGAARRSPLCGSCAQLKRYGHC